MEALIAVAHEELEDGAPAEEDAEEVDVWVIECVVYFEAEEEERGDDEGDVETGDSSVFQVLGLDWLGLVRDNWDGLVHVWGVGWIYAEIKGKHWILWNWQERRVICVWKWCRLGWKWHDLVWKRCDFGFGFVVISSAAPVECECEYDVDCNVPVEGVVWG